MGARRTHVRALRQGGAARRTPRARRLARQGRASLLIRFGLDGAKCASEEDERVFAGRHADLLYASHDDPVVPRGMLGDDLALEAREGVGEQRHAAGTGLPVETRETVRAGGGGAGGGVLLLPSQPGHADTPPPPPAPP